MTRNRSSAVMQGEGVRVLQGDCRERMAEMDAESVDSCVTDPPYHLTSIVKRFGADNAAPCKAGKTGAYARASKGFMGQQWDGGDVAFQPETWAGVFRVLKPGAHLIAFSGTRTYHRMVCAIEDAGFEIRDQLAWVYGSGFPKSHDVSKGIDRAAGAVRASANGFGGSSGIYSPMSEMCNVTDPATDEAAQWQGWGTALKPAWEPIVLARKPLVGTVAANVLQHGTGAINIDGCRIEGAGNKTFERDAGERSREQYRMGTTIGSAIPSDLGRWPANIVHDGSEEVLAGFPDSDAGQPRDDRGQGGIWQAGNGVPCGPQHGDSGSAARFFYTAKAGPLDRLGSRHPTVKPVDLMRWLCRLVTPQGGMILDPFAGSGSTGIAALAEGFGCTMFDTEAAHVADIERKLAIVNGDGAHMLTELHRGREQKPLGGLFGAAA